MKNLIKLPGNIKLRIEAETDYTEPMGPDGKYSNKIEYRIPIQIIDLINNIIENQEELEERIDKILKSRIGKSIVNLEPRNKDGEN